MIDSFFYTTTNFFYTRNTTPPLDRAQVWQLPVTILTKIKHHITLNANVAVQVFVLCTTAGFWA
jgi:hypothetical protein